MSSSSTFGCLTSTLGLFLERVEYVDDLAELDRVHEPVRAARIRSDDLDDVAE